MDNHFKCWKYVDKHRKKAVAKVWDYTWLHICFKCRVCLTFILMRDSLTIACIRRWDSGRKDSDAPHLYRHPHRMGCSSRESTCRGKQQNDSSLVKTIDDKSQSLHWKVDAPTCSKRVRCFYPKIVRPPQMAQVIKPAWCSVWVITVCWQWGQTVWPGMSCRLGVTTTWVTEEYRCTKHKIKLSLFFRCILSCKLNIHNEIVCLAWAISQCRIQLET